MAEQLLSRDVITMADLQGMNRVTLFQVCSALELTVDASTKKTAAVWLIAEALQKQEKMVTGDEPGQTVTATPPSKTHTTSPTSELSFSPSLALENIKLQMALHEQEVRLRKEQAALS